MTQEEKARAYDKAIERAKKLRYAPNADKIPTYAGRVVNEIFPELAESEDERIRRWIIDDIRFNMNNEPLNNSEYRKKAEKAIAWLEKQGEKPVEEYNITGIGKAEPKFHEGDWITHNTANFVFKVINVGSNGYEVVNRENYKKTISSDNADNYHIWAVQDAKDGDVLAFYSEYNKMVQAGIIEKYVGKHGGCSNTFKIYVGVNWDNNLQIGKYMGCSNIRPATKEQRDNLIKAMADAGYTFDFEKKELKKIENEIEIPFGAKDSELQEATYFIPKGFHAEIKGDSVFIKKGEKPTAWSEEDETGWTNTMIMIKEVASNHYTKDSIKLVVNFLKSIKERYTWNPTDEEMKEALRTEYEKGRADAIAQMQKEWSEEDENIKEDLVLNLQENYRNKYINERTCLDEINWLKSLKQRIGG